MPTPLTPPFIKSYCPTCGWSTVTRQRSDALVLPGLCDSCGKPLVNKSANAIEAMDKSLGALLRKLFTGR